MTTSHRNLDGTWAACEEPDTCELKFHFPGMTVAEAEAMPMPVLLALLNVIDPPSFVNPAGELWWQDSSVRMHREYDLPAWISPDYCMEWWVEGHLHRMGKPAKIYDPPSRILDENEQYFEYGARVDAPQVQS